MQVGKVLIGLVFVVLIAGIVSAALELGTNTGFLYAGSSPNVDPWEDLDGVDTMAWSIKDTAPVGATKVTEIGWWCDTATEAANFEVGIYDHSVGDDNPEAKVGDFAIDNAKGTTAGWKKVTGLNIPITAGTIYWIAMQLNDTATATEISIEGTGTPGSKSVRKAGQTALIDPWGADTGFEMLIGLYAVTDAPPPEATGSQVSHLKLNENSGTAVHYLNFTNASTTLPSVISGATWQNDGINITLTENTDYTLSGADFKVINMNLAWSEIKADFTSKRYDTFGFHVGMMKIISGFVALALLVFAYILMKSIWRTEKLE